ncbi:MAG: DEAD/DEAH box helicase family protein, partial [Bdellovibrionales bacterium]|nr:DEAD/DEAH box helicase family protein [Bdellovibrionales bacterium]
MSKKSQSSPVLVRSPKDRIIALLQKQLKLPLDDQGHVLFKLNFEACLENPNCIEVFFSLERATNSKVLSQGIVPLRISWSTEEQAPRHLKKKGHAFELRLPEELLNRIDENKLSYLLKRLLVGHSLHANGPNFDLPESSFQWRQIQKDAVDVGSAFIESRERKLLIVSPPGSGKTEIIASQLRALVELGANNPESSGIHLVIANSIDLVDQLYTDLSSRRMLNSHILRWGGIEHRAGTIEELVNRLSEWNQRGESAVLVTTIKSLVLRMGENATVAYEDNLNRLKPRLRSVTFDEVHHVGAQLTHPLILSLSRLNDKVFFQGFTATPEHREKSVLETFGNRAYWTYLDSVQQFFDRGGIVERPFSDVVDQIFMAVDRGDLTPVGRVSFLDEVLASGTPLFVGNGGGHRAVINPEAQQE